MRSTSFVLAGVAALEAVVAAPSPPANVFKLKPLHFDLTPEVPRMLEIINRTRLPDQPVYPGLGSSMGIDLDVLKSLRDEWLYEFDWDREQRDMNRFVQISNRAH